MPLPPHNLIHTRRPPRPPPQPYIPEPHSPPQPITDLEHDGAVALVIALHVPFAGPLHILLQPGQRTVQDAEC